MTDLEQMLKQRAELDAKIKAASVAEDNECLTVLANHIIKCKERGILPAAYDEASRDKNGVFNPRRVCKLKRVKG